MQLELVNGPLVGLVMREACKRAMYHALTRCFEVEAEVKGSKADGRTDWVTAADRECQKIVVDLLRECFPHFGVIGEEEGLNVPCPIPGRNIYFTIDPIDGTSAYTRHQSHGWGCMICLVDGDSVVAVCVGDANSGEMYYYRPNSQNTHRLVRRGEHIRDVPLIVDENNALSMQAILLRDLPSAHDVATRHLIGHGPFGKMLMADGSIGLSMARLWKGEVGACVLKGEKQTPWDDTPIIGMSLRLGFVFFDVKLSSNPDAQIDLVARVPTPPTAEGPREFQQLVIHHSRIPELHPAMCRVDTSALN